MTDPDARPAGVSTPGLAPDEYDALTRLDFWIFVNRVFVELTGGMLDDNWHVQLLCAEVDRVRTTPNTKLAVALPPRSLKSIIVSVALPAWLLGHDPGAEIVCVSYGQELADQLSADCRRIMLTPWYRRLFPATVLDRQAVGNLATSVGGKRYATSVGGTLTGMGADVIIVDDPMKPDEALSDAERTRANQWARHTLFTRLNRKADQRIILVQQRLHPDDMIGHLMEFAGFELLAFPAIAPEDETHVIRTPFGTLTHTRREGEALHPAREPLDVLEQQRILLGTEYFAAQYLQSPAPPGGGLVKLDWFRRYDAATLPHFVQMIHSWDTAVKTGELNDYSACTIWGVTAGRDIYLLHVVRARLEYPDLKRRIADLARAWQPSTILIEDAASGAQLIQSLRAERYLPVTAVRARGDKVLRMRNQTALIEAGRVWLPREAPGLDAYLHELALFPKGKFDDQVDATAQALEHIGWPEEVPGFIALIRAEHLAEYGLRPEDLTIAFDHVDPRISFNAGSGRVIARGSDGLFRCSRAEWTQVTPIGGIRLVEDASALAG